MRVRCLLLGVSVVLLLGGWGLAGAKQAPLQPPIIHYYAEQDANGNGVDDALEAQLQAQAAPPEGAGATTPVIVTLFRPVQHKHTAAFAALGGKLRHVYSHVAYGFAGELPAAAIEPLARALGGDLCIIEPDLPTQLHLEDSTRIIGVRPGLWTTGYRGASEVVAVLDTGLDSSHTDLSSGKVVAWHDATADGTSSPVDYQGHGTHVASTVAGTGAALPASSLGSMTSLSYTFSGAFGSIPYGYWSGFLHRVNIGATGTFTQQMFYSGTATHRLGRALYPYSSTTYTNGYASPFTQTATLSTTGRYQLRSEAANASGAGNGSYSAFSTRITIPYVPAPALVGDGYNLFSGVAPEAGLVGVKIFTNAGSGTSSDMIAGMDWIIANRDTYGIRVASMSVGLVNGGTMTSLRDKANTVVANGIVFAISAGNDYPTYTIGDPALAAKVIAVAATDDANAITSYTSNGGTGSLKPDLAAPGGSFADDYSSSEIMAADSNSSDGSTYPGGANPAFFADQTANDYTMMSGTSMACPHVAGAAALLIQAWGNAGHTWGYTEAEALTVKALLLMTASETNKTGEAGHTPTLNRDGTKDLVEGYGRMCTEAAAEALTQSLAIPDSATSTLGNGSFDRRVWARQVALTSGTEYTFTLTNPAGGDFDLYLYSDTHTAGGTSDGDPILAAPVSANSGVGVAETITYTPTETGTYYLVVKWVSGSGTFEVAATGPAVHELSVSASADPTTVASGGTTDLTGSATDSLGHGLTWSWVANVGGGSFDDASAQNPIYTVPGNASDIDLPVTLTLTATCDGPSPIENSDAVVVTVQPVTHAFTVTAGTPDPATVASGGTTSLSATATDSRAGHNATGWTWSDGGAGGTFLPSDAEQNPDYVAAENTTDSDQVVTLTVSAQCDGAESLSDSDTTTLAVQPVAHALSVEVTLDPATVPLSGTTHCSVVVSDSRTHELTYTWSDGGAGGNFSDTAAPNPTYTAPDNHTGSEITIPISVQVNCSGGLSDTDEAALTVLPIGVDSIGLYDPAASKFYLRNPNTSGVAELTFQFGKRNNTGIPIIGDWNGDGVDTIGLYQPAASLFMLGNYNTNSGADYVFQFGSKGCGWTPVVGDWDGDGVDTVGLYNPATSRFYLRNSNTAGVADIVFQFGQRGNGGTPITGDWNGDGVDTVGLYAPAGSLFILGNSLSGTADLVFQFGSKGCGWTPRIGDWNGDGADTIGLYCPATSKFYLRNTNTAGVADLTFQYGQRGIGWKPVVGDWDGR